MRNSGVQIAQRKLSSTFQFVGDSDFSIPTRNNQ